MGISSKWRRWDYNAFFSISYLVETLGTPGMRKLQAVWSWKSRKYSEPPSTNIFSKMITTSFPSNVTHMIQIVVKEELLILRTYNKIR
jgi:hypothetical protein